MDSGTEAARPAGPGARVVPQSVMPSTGPTGDGQASHRDRGTGAGHGQIAESGASRSGSAGSFECSRGLRATLCRTPRTVDWCPGRHRTEGPRESESSARRPARALPATRPVPCLVCHRLRLAEKRGEGEGLGTVDHSGTDPSTPQVTRARAGRTPTRTAPHALPKPAPRPAGFMPLAHFRNMFPTNTPRGEGAEGPPW